MISEDCQFGNGRITKSQLNALESGLDSLFSSLNIEVEFTKHFFDRVNDGRNKSQITLCELSDLFQALYRKYNLHLLDLSSKRKEIEEMVKSITTNINIPFHMKWNNNKNELELIAKTIMRKKDFRTRTRVLKVESFKEFMKERWVRSGESSWHGNIEVFVNPTGKELRGMPESLRGWIAQNGNFYAGSDGIHPDIAKTAGNEMDKRTSVPIIITDRTDKLTTITFGDAIYNTKFKNDYEAAVKQIESSLWIRRMYPNATITGEIYDF